MSHRRSTVVCAITALLLLGASMPSPAATTPRGLEGHLEIGRWSHAAEDPIELTFTLSNSSGAPVAVLRWQTPADGVDADILRVTRDGEPVPYVGRLIKRAEPLAEDYLVLQPGETFSVTFDPSAAYDMSTEGHYSIRYQAPLQSGYFEVAAAADADLLLGPARMPELESNPVQLWVEGLRVRDHERLTIDTAGFKKPGTGGGGGTVGNTTFVGCTTSQQSTLTTARANALTISTKASSYLGTNSDSGGMYKTWFDYSGSGSGWNTVKSNFAAIQDVFATKAMTFDCSCNQRYYAYVYPTQPYKVYLCRIFWSAPNLGTDSKAGTLVHETSHFNVVAGTDDFVYGTTGAMNLAKTDPAKAIKNADNHEYFAEHQK